MRTCSTEGSRLLAAKVPPDLADEIQRRAVNADRSVSAEIRVALRSHIAESTQSESAPDKSAFAEPRADGARHATG